MKNPQLYRRTGVGLLAARPGNSMIAPVKKFGRTRLSTDFGGRETWRISAESVCKVWLTFSLFHIQASKEKFQLPYI